MSAIDSLGGVRRSLHERLLRRVDARELELVSRAERRLRVREEALAVLREEGHILPQGALARVVNEVSDAVVGMGPIEYLLKDPDVSEVMVNGPDDVYVERKGRIERVADRLFEGEEAVFHLIERIVAPLGLRVDGSSPWVDARLSDGSRVHAIVPPLSLCGPVLTIRKFSAVPLGPGNLVENGTLGPRMLAFLAACVRGRANVVVSGGTSSGKTTLLGVLSSFVPDGERIVTIEDAAELRLAKPHVIGLEARPANVEGEGEITVRELVRNALRMRPDRIVVGEVRGGEALDMLQAMNTGHDGSLSTAHANSARHLLWRL
jgi:pilus assembly protein CpaF